MDRWHGRVVLVNDASLAFGATLCKVLAQSGMNVIGAAKDIDNLQAVADSLKGENGSLLAVKCDLAKDEDIYALFYKAKEVYGGVDICINSGRLLVEKSLLDATPEEWRQMIDVNLIAVCLCTKLAVASMRERGVDDGHIINVSSMSGHRVITKPESHFYAGVKHAIRAITEGVRQELRAASSHIRISLISAGNLEYDFDARIFNDAVKVDRSNESKNRIQSEDFADLILHVIGSAPHVEINDVLLRPIEQIL